MTRSGLSSTSQMITLGIFLATIGLVMAIASRISPEPPMLYFGLPAVIIAIIGLAVLGFAGIDLKDYLRTD